jgi:hypothetical protein
MKAIVATRFGEPADVLELKTLPDPTPPGPGEVVVRVTKRQLHPGNLSMIRGRFNIPLPSGGLVPGGDGVGIVGPPCHFLPACGKRGRTWAPPDTSAAAPPPSAVHRYVFTLRTVTVDKLPVPSDASGALAGFATNVNKVGEASFTVTYGN